MADPILTLTDELRHFFNQELSRITDYEGNLVGYAMTVEQWRAFCATIDAIIARMVADAEERDSYDDRCYDSQAPQARFAATWNQAWQLGQIEALCEAARVWPWHDSGKKWLNDRADQIKKKCANETNS